MSNTHSGAKGELLKASVIVRRNLIGKGQSTNIAREQTFMKRVKTTGEISSFTTQEGVYEKWILIRPFQAAYVHAFAGICGLNDKEQMRRFNRATYMKKIGKKLKKLFGILTEHLLNPFDGSPAIKIIFIIHHLANQHQILHSNAC